MTHDRNHAHACCGSAGKATESPTHVDPVCGMQVTESIPHRTAHAGKAIYFCSSGCKTKFEAEPARFVERLHEHPVSKPVEPAQPGTIYTCPMHPEIRQDHPGNCPKCGMALEPLLPAFDADESNPELVDFQRRFWWTANIRSGTRSSLPQEGRDSSFAMSRISRALLASVCAALWKVRSSHLATVL